MEASQKKVKELGNSQQEAELNHDDALKTLWNECEAVSKERLNATERRDESAKARLEATDVSDSLNAERDIASEIYHQVLSSAHPIAKAHFKRKIRRRIRVISFVYLREGSNGGRTRASGGCFVIAAKRDPAGTEARRERAAVAGIHFLAEGASLRVKAEKMRLATSQFQAKSDAIFMKTDELWTPRDIQRR